LAQGAAGNIKLWTNNRCDTRATVGHNSVKGGGIYWTTGTGNNGEVCQCEYLVGSMPAGKEGEGITAHDKPQRHIIPILVVQCM
jgi:hypothetical protein